MRTWPLGLMAWITSGLVTLLFAFWHPTVDQLIQLVSAVGTSAAAIVALWLGLSESRKRDRRDWEQACLTAAGIEEGLITASDALTYYVMCNSPDAGPGDINRFQATRSEQEYNVRQLLSLASLRALHIDASVLATLVALPNRAAHKLHAASAIFRAMKEQITASYPANWDSLLDDERERFLFFWDCELARASKLVKEALHEISKAAAL